VIPDDTSPEAFAAQVRFYRRLGPEGRLRLMLELCDDARELAADGIRLRNPALGPEEVRREVARLFNELAPAIG
jgi:hypothetical protein